MRDAKLAQRLYHRFRPVIGKDCGAGSMNTVRVKVEVRSRPCPSIPAGHEDTSISNHCAPAAPATSAARSVLSCAVRSSMRFWISAIIDAWW